MLAKGFAVAGATFVAFLIAVFIWVGWTTRVNYQTADMELIVEIHSRQLTTIQETLISIDDRLKLQEQHWTETHPKKGVR